MGDYTTLSINGKGIFDWKYDLPRYPILNLLFTEDNKVIEKWAEEEDDHSVYYKTNVSNVKQRLLDFGVDRNTIFNLICKLHKINPDDVSRIDFEDYDAWFVFKETESLEKENDMEMDEEDKHFLDLPYGPGEIQLLLDLYLIWKHLDDSNDEDEVILDPNPVLQIYEKDELEKLTLVNDELIFNESVDIPLFERYLDNAYLHFLKKEFSVVYIELIIALEIVAKEFIKRKSLKFKENNPGTELDIDKFFEKAGLMNTIRFGLGFFLKEEDIESELINNCVKIYDIRNNVIHREAKSFEIEKVSKAIQDVCKITNILQKE